MIESLFVVVWTENIVIDHKRFIDFNLEREKEPKLKKRERHTQIKSVIKMRRHDNNRDKNTAKIYN